MPELIALFHEIEAQATIPQQWSTALIALMPQNQDIERPIALVASRYRLWCKVRAPYTKQWQLDIQDLYQWERAVPGTECLKVALRRAFMTEHHQALKGTVISVLMDMSTSMAASTLTSSHRDGWILSTQPPMLLLPCRSTVEAEPLKHPDLCRPRMGFWPEIHRLLRQPRST